MTGDEMAEKQLQPRPYQLEMLEESMKRNIIVVMDTGSGKTHVAVLRVQEELKRCTENKRVWFIAPRVALAEQQHKVLKESILGVQHRLLTGNDEVDKWSNKGVWDIALDKKRVVVSTPQCLLDALDHGFVQLADLSLLVVDEAHHCTGLAPVKQIMSDFYFQAKHQGLDRPSILGLTASPVTRSNPEAIIKIERALDSTICTPRTSRSALLQFSNRPVTRPVFYVPSSVLESRNPPPASHAQVDLSDTTSMSPNMSSILSARVFALRKAIVEYDFSQDPYVLSRIGSTDEALEVAVESIRSKTFCSKALKSLNSKAFDISHNLGPWAADWFIEECNNRLRGHHEDQTFFLDWSTSERKHLLKILDKIVSDFTRHKDLGLGMTDKVRKLMGIFGKDSDVKRTGIIFAKTRADVACLAQLLSANTWTSGLRVGTFVGTSSRLTRKTEIADLADLKQQQHDLKAFRNGELDLIIATNVLEEGIDVPRCNLVIAFEKPENLRSFIQRRGRARDASSEYLIFLRRDDMRDWETLEQELVKKYLEEDRTRETAHAQESREETNSRFFRVEETNALLTPQNAITHLNNFCHSLRGQFANLNPVFSTIELTPELPETLLSVRVDLPLAVHPYLRSHRSKEAWHTERAAKRDAAFCAYLALYQAGLVNKNLLPVYNKIDEDLEASTTWEDHAAVAKVSELTDPWTYVAQRRQDERHTLYASEVFTEVGGKECNDLLLVLPTPVLMGITKKLFWNQDTETTLSIRPSRATYLSLKDLSVVRSASQLILSSVYEKSIDQSRTDFMPLFVPNMDFAQLEDWAEHSAGSQPAREMASLSAHPSTLSFLPQVIPGALNADTCGLVRDQTHWQARFIAKRFLETIPTLEGRSSNDGRSETEPEQQLCIEAIKLPKRRDFLHVVPRANASEANPSYTTARYISVDSCTIDNLPAAYSVSALLIPSITHIVTIQKIADQLNRTLLAPVGITDLPLVLRAICASSADEQDGDYQRLEFLGDNILKFLVSLQLMASNPHWPESFLTAKKSRMVSNKTLSHAAVTVGLDKFIISQKFTGRKWKPRYDGDESSTLNKKREMSTKILADVVEALVGAAYVDGTKSGSDSDSSQVVREAPPSSQTPNLLKGLSKALECIKLFYPRTQWMDVTELQSHIQGQSRQVPIPPGQYSQLSKPESILDRTFTNKSLLVTALTHPSYNITASLGSPTADHDTAQQPAPESYQRLEFLGDAILDLLVTTALFEFRDVQDKELPHHDLHHFREALVNGSFLAFLCLERRVSEERTDVHTRVVPRKRKTRGEGSRGTTPSTEDATPEGDQVPSDFMSASAARKADKYRKLVVETSTHKSTVNMSLPHFMQRDTMSAQLAVAQSLTEKLHVRLRDGILSAFDTPEDNNDSDSDGGVALAAPHPQPYISPERNENQKPRKSYPWAHLSQLHAPKHLSDIIESCIAAVWLDSAGDFDAVRHTLDILELTRYASVMLGQGHEAESSGPRFWNRGETAGQFQTERMDVLHPKESLGQHVGVLNKGRHHMDKSNLRVKYEISADEPIDAVSEEKVPRGDRACTLSIGEVVVARVGGAFSRLEAETRVAEIAMRGVDSGEGWEGVVGVEGTCGEPTTAGAREE